MFEGKTEKEGGQAGLFGDRDCRGWGEDGRDAGVCVIDVQHWLR